jgi:uncharacterized protein (TIGR00369 family)
MATYFERMQGWVRGDVTPPPIADLIGFRLTAVVPGSVTFEMEAGPQHANPMGTMHGGVFCDLADAAMASAFATLLVPGESMTTLELKINFFKPVWNTQLRAVGTVVKRGKTVGMVECDVFDADGSLVARASSTCMILRGEQAAGR